MSEDKTVGTGENAQETTVREKKVKTGKEKCPNCGNNLVFNPKTQKLYCSYCESEFAFKQNTAYVEKDLMEAVGEDKPWDGDVKTFVCHNCGAKVVLDKNEQATVCPFCDTAHVVETKEYVGLKPNVVVPFTLTAEDASEAFKRFVKKKLFAPSPFKKKFAPDSVKGVYYPCFTFDSMTHSSYEGRIGIHHTRTVGSGKNAHTETYTEWKNIAGNYDEFFNDVTVSAGSKISEKELDKINDYSATQNRVYEDKYLYGFMAYAKEEDVVPCWDKAKGKIDAALRDDILSQYHHDVVDYLNVYTEHEKVTYKYELLPMYVASSTYNKKVYRLLSNGTTGKTTGKTPVSPWRVGLAVLLGIGIIVGIALCYHFGLFDAILNG